MYGEELWKQCVVDRVHEDIVSVEMVNEKGLMSDLRWKPEYGEQPKVGDFLQVCSTGFGGEIRGYMWPDGRLIYYNDEAERERLRTTWLEEYAEEKRKRFAENKDTYRTRVDALDLPFRARMERFIAEKGFEEFFTDDGGYELFTVEQANALHKEYLTTFQPTASWMSKKEKDEHAILWFTGFNAMSYDQQKRAFPAMDGGHSGNTFGGMVSLARAVATGKDI